MLDVNLELRMLFKSYCDSFGWIWLPGPTPMNLEFPKAPQTSLEVPAPAQISLNVASTEIYRNNLKPKTTHNETTEKLSATVKAKKFHSYSLYVISEFQWNFDLFESFRLF